MKRNVSALLGILFCLTPLFGWTSEIAITLQVTNPSTQAVYIQEAHLDQSQLSKTHRIDLSTAGFAKFAYPVSEPTFFELQYNGYSIPVFLEPTSSPVISFDAQNIANTLQFSGVGSADNNFIAAYNRLSGGTALSSIECAYLDIVCSADLAKKANILTAADYTLFIQKRGQEQLRLLTTNRNGISKKVYDYYDLESKSTQQSNKLIWVLQRWNALDNSAINAAKSQLKMSNSNLSITASAIQHPAYKNALKAQLIGAYLPSDPFKQRAYVPIYDLISQKFSGQEACYLSTHLLIKIYEKSGATELGRSKISALQNQCPQYTDAVMQMYGGDISGVENIAAEEIDMIDKSGSLVALEDYRGQVVYISFWASWCKPCIAGFKKSEATRKQLQDMGVVLINISIDKKEEAWRDAMIRHNPLGINSWAISLSDLAKDYDISSIPLYHIVDKNGKFAYLSDTGNRDIVEEFRKLVQQ